jgi:hypothetical protein
MIKGKKITRATFISASLKAQQEEVAMFAKLQKKTQLTGGGEGRVRQQRAYGGGVPLVLFSPEDTVNNEEVWCTEEKLLNRALSGRKVELNPVSIICSDIQLPVYMGDPWS